MKKEWLIVALILIGAFVVRLYRFNGPIADWHSWRQSDTSAVSFFLTKDNFDVLHPKYFDISNVQSGFDNPQGYRFVEFPLYNLAQAGLYTTFHHFTLEEWGRIVTIFSTCTSVFFLYLLGKRHGNTTIGLAASLFYAFVPYSIYYGRTVLADPSMAMSVLGAIYFFDKWLEGRFWAFIASLIFMVAALLLKPYAIFFSLPLLYLAFGKWSWKLILKPLLWIYAILSIAPLIWWRFWMLKYPQGIPVSDWLFNGGNIRFTGAYFYWLFAQRINNLILGFWGLPIVLVGLLGKKKEFGFFLSFVLSSLIYIVVIARGNVQHDYYQILIIPSLALVFGLGVDFLISFPKDTVQKIFAWGILGVCSIFILAFGWYQIRDYFNINNWAMVHAGQAVERLTPEGAKVIAPYDGDTTFLYQAKRQGWPSFEHSLPDLIKMGANYLVLLNPTPENVALGKQYKIVAQSQEYILLNLNQKP